MKLIIQLSLSFIVLIGTHFAATAQDLLPGITPLENGSVADAGQLNSNMSVVSSEILTLQDQIELLIDASPRLIRLPDGNQRLSTGVRIVSNNGELSVDAQNSTEESSLVVLEGGQLILDVDCTGDPYALINAYQGHTQYSRIIFNITGECYGDIFWSADYTKYVQEFSQNITINGANPDSSYAVIKPRPLVSESCVSSGNGGTGGKSSLVASFGGSLYMDFVELRLGECDSVGVLYSRGAGGDLNEVRIIGSDQRDATLVEVRHNAIIYLGHVELQGQHPSSSGLRIWNGGTVYAYGGIWGGPGLVVDMGSWEESPSLSLGWALAMFSDGSFFNWGGSASLTANNALYMSESQFTVNEYTAGERLTVINGNLNLFRDTTFKTQNLHLTAESAQDNRISGSLLEVGGILSSSVDQIFQCSGLSTVNLPPQPEEVSTYATAPTCMSESEWSNLISTHLGSSP